MSDSASFNPNPEAHLSTWLEEQDARAALAAAARPVNKTALFDALARAGITTVVVAFDGSGDEGQIESVSVLAGESTVGLPTDSIAISELRRDGSGLESRTCPLAEAIETLAYDCLGEVAGGWQDNDGAFGEIRFTVAERTITLELNTRVMESDYSEHVF